MRWAIAPLHLAGLDLCFLHHVCPSQAFGLFVTKMQVKTHASLASKQKGEILRARHTDIGSERAVPSWPCCWLSVLVLYLPACCNFWVLVPCRLCFSGCCIRPALYTYVAVYRWSHRRSGSIATGVAVIIRECKQADIACRRGVASCYPTRCRLAVPIRSYDLRIILECQATRGNPPLDYSARVPCSPASGIRGVARRDCPVCPFGCTPRYRYRTYPSVF